GSLRCAAESSIETPGGAQEQRARDRGHDEQGRGHAGASRAAAARPIAVMPGMYLVLMSVMNIPRRQTPGEEIANATSHGIGLLLAIAALPLLVWQAGRLGGPADVVG